MWVRQIVLQKRNKRKQKKKAHPYDYNRMKSIAGEYLDEDEDEDYADDNIDEEKRKLARRANGRKQLQYLDNKGLNDPKCIVILVPGTDTYNNFLSSWSNGPGKSSQEPRVRLFQVADEPLAWVMDGLFRNVAALPKKLPYWKNALFSENAVAYNSTEGGLFRGYQSYDHDCKLKGNRKVIKQGWELKIICLDKYFHDLFRDKLLGILDERGMEKESARNQ
jgi:hypothetical protein